VSVSGAIRLGIDYLPYTGGELQEAANLALISAVHYNHLIFAQSVL
jgi:hypothetical protein